MALQSSLHAYVSLCALLGPDPTASASASYRCSSGETSTAAQAAAQRIHHQVDQSATGSNPLTPHGWSYDRSSDKHHAHEPLIAVCWYADHQVPASHLTTFHARYGSLLKASMALSMRKRDKKREKARAEAQAKRTREVYEDVPLGEGGKRGKGRRQRVCLFIVFRRV